MLIILSQKIDTASDYADEAFRTYHYPKRYKNQIHEGDTFVYYQGNRFVKEQRYYFGTGTVGHIFTNDEENYYATLIECQKFLNTIPIYLPDGRYVEQLGFATIRKSSMPPWQSSIRPLSQQAYEYIVSRAGINIAATCNTPIDELKERLKAYVRAFYLDNDVNAIRGIENAATQIMLNLGMADVTVENEPIEQNSTGSKDSIQNFVEYCKKTHLTYSYKPVLILAFIEHANKHGVMKLADGIEYVRAYYQRRRDQNMEVEKHNSIYEKSDISNEDIRRNLIANPVKALVNSGFFLFNQDNDELMLLPELWLLLDKNAKICIRTICQQRLDKYYNG